MKMLDNMFNGKESEGESEKGALLDFLAKQKLKKAPPFQDAKISNSFAEQTQLKPSADRKLRQGIVVAPYSADCYFNIDSIDPQIKDRIVTNDFWVWANEYVVSDAMFFMKSTPVDQRLNFSLTLLTPLTKQWGEMKSICLKLFRLQFKICQARDKTYLPHYKIRRLLEILLNNSAEVKDECLLQLIKQTRVNPYIGKDFNEWKLLAIIVSFIAPSENFFNYFLNYVHSVYLGTQEDDMRQWAKYVIRRCLQTNEKSERLVLPCIEELRAIEERRKIPVEVYYLNAASEVFFFESYSTIGEVKEEIIKKYEFDPANTHKYGIYEVCKKVESYEETYIEDRIKILDVMASWTNEVDFLRAKSGQEDIEIEFRLYFKVRFSYEIKSVQDQVLYYYEALYYFKRLRYDLDFETFKKLLVLKLRIDFGDPDPEKLNHIRLNFYDESPRIDLMGISDAKFKAMIENVIADYSKNTLSVLDAQKSFLDICKGFRLYLCDLFPVKLFERKDQEDQNVYNLPHKMVLGVRSDCIFIFDEQYHLLREINYNSVLKWGYSAKLFILIVSTTENELPVKISFQTKMASTIVYFLNSFMNMKLGKEPEPNTMVVNENVTRQIFKNKFFKKMNRFKRRFIMFPELLEDAQKQAAAAQAAPAKPVTASQADKSIKETPKENLIREEKEKKPLLKVN